MIIMRITACQRGRKVKDCENQRKLISARTRPPLTMHSPVATPYHAVQSDGKGNCIATSLILPKLVALFPGTNCGNACVTWGFAIKIFHSAINLLYDVGVHLSIKLDVGLLDPIDAAVDVKQECPWSLLLFEQFIEGLAEANFQAKLPTAGPLCGGSYMSLAPDVCR
jgi:hypothetical protein